MTKIRILDVALGYLLLIPCAFLPTVSAANEGSVKLPEFRSLSDKATESVNISVSPWLLKMAGAFIEDKDEDSVATKRLLSGIKSIEIRSYKFAVENVYSPSDIAGVRNQLSGPGWSRLMQVHHRDKSEDVDMYLLIENNVSKGFALISSQPLEFTIINIVGSISVEDLPKLQSHLHLPKVDDIRTNLLM